jgi:hypothetical protein
MLFSLEALRAKHGDCLILHSGERAEPRLIVIDGGPVGVFNDALYPRLEGMAKTIGQDGKLPIDMVMVSHIDDDHIHGILELTGFLKEEQNRAEPFDVRTLWLNAFDDLIGNDADELAAGVSEAPGRVAERGGPGDWNGKARAVLASVPQGKTLRDNARGLGWRFNEGFKSFAMAPALGGGKVKIGELQLTVVSPRLPQLQALQKEWRNKLQAMKSAKPAEVASIAESIDDSVYNLSSIVCLAEVAGKRILLTGDALGTNVTEGLCAADLLDSHGKIKVDVLKLPHHGSDRNVDRSFFDAIHADHYVVSGDGKYHNPEPKTFKLISESRRDARNRPEDDFTVHLTYEKCSDGVGAELAAFFADERKAKRNYTVNFRREKDLALRVDLLDAVNY